MLELWRTVLQDYLSLDPAERLFFLEQVVKLDPWKVEYAKMGESERKFHNSDAKRGE